MEGLCAINLSRDECESLGFVTFQEVSTAYVPPGCTHNQDGTMAMYNDWTDLVAYTPCNEYQVCVCEETSDGSEEENSMDEPGMIDLLSQSHLG